jgi:hypothetical protein
VSGPGVRPGRGIPEQTLSPLRVLFEPEAPLAQFDAWLADEPQTWPDLEPMLAELGRRQPACAILHRLLDAGGVLARRRLTCPPTACPGGLPPGVACRSLDTAGLDLSATVDLLAADLTPTPGGRRCRLRLADFEREAVAARLLGASAREPDSLWR